MKRGDKAADQSLRLAWAASIDALRCMPTHQRRDRSLLRAIIRRVELLREARTKGPA